MKATYSQVSLEALIAELKAAQASPRLIGKVQSLLEKITRETSNLTLAAVGKELSRDFGDTPSIYSYDRRSSDGGYDMLIFKYFLLFLVCCFLAVLALPIFLISFLAVSVLLVAALII